MPTPLNRTITAPFNLWTLQVYLFTASSDRDRFQLTNRKIIFREEKFRCQFFINLCLSLSTSKCAGQLAESKTWEASKQRNKSRKCLFFANKLPQNPWLLFSFKIHVRYNTLTPENYYEKSGSGWY